MAKGEAIPYGSASTVIDDFTGVSMFVLHDMDRDGDLDILAASPDTDTVSWFENDGAGNTWTEHVVASDADGARGVAAADIDNDGDVDVVAASNLDDTIAWFENDSGYTRRDIDTGAVGATSVAVGDVDRDGHLDIAASSEGDDTIAWYLSSGAATPTFTFQSITTGADGASAVVLADVNSDGFLDIVAASAEDDSVVFWKSDGGPTPAFSSTTVTNSADGVTGVAVGDVNSSGVLDIVVASPLDDTVAWYENDGAASPAFTEHVIDSAADGAGSVAIADVDRDGDTDVLGSVTGTNQLVWWDNNGSWTEREVTSVLTSASSVGFADIDDDGRPDFLGASASLADIVYYPNASIHRSFLYDGSITIDETGINSFIVPIQSVDLDHDGDLDLVVGEYGTSILGNKLVWFENDAATWTRHVINSSSVSPWGIDVGDADGDGTLDIACVSVRGDKIVVFFNDNGDGSSWSTVTADSSINGPHSTAFADVDNDGDLDLIAAAPLETSIGVYVYHNTASDGSTWSETNLGTTTKDAVSVDVGDIDQDGDADLLVLRNVNGSGGLDFWENANGLGTSWTQHVIESDTGGLFPHRLVDLDEDGDLDALGGKSQMTANWWENTAGDGSAWSVHQISSGNEQLATAFNGGEWLEPVDLDEDGDLDLLGSRTTVLYLIWFENTVGDASAWTYHDELYGASDDTYGIATGDFDRDGDVDVASVSRFTPTVVWYENQGGQFALTTTNVAPSVMYEGDEDSVLKIEASHLGASGDSDMELASLELLFEETDGDFLTPTEAGDLIDTVSVYLDEGSGSFEQGSDTLVAMTDTTGIADGVLTIALPDADASATVSAESLKVYFLVVAMTSDAFSQTPDTFRVTHIVSESTAEDAANDGGLQQAAADDVFSGLMTIDTHIPGTPTINAEPAFTAGASNTVSWTGDDEAAVYRVQYDDNDQFTSPSETTVNDPESSVAISGLSDNTEYWYRVRGENGYGNSSYSAAVSSTQDTGAPSSTASLSATRAVGSILDIVWSVSDSVSGPATVALFYRKDGGDTIPFGAYVHDAGTVSFDMAIHGGPGTYEFYSIASDSAGNVEGFDGWDFGHSSLLAAADPTDILYVSNYYQEILAVDLNSGDRWVVSGGSYGNGPAFGNLYGIVVENEQSLLVLSHDPENVLLPQIFRVNRDTGERSIVTDANDGGKGQQFYIPVHLATDGQGTAYVGDPDAGLVKINLSTGNRTLVSSTLGYAGPYGIAAVSSSLVYMAPYSPLLVFSRNPSAGGNTQVASAFDGGTEFQAYKMRLDASNNLYVTGDGEIVFINGSTFARSVYTAIGYDYLSDFELADDGGIYVISSSGNALRHIEVPGGTDTLVSGDPGGANVGTGPDIRAPYLALPPASEEVDTDGDGLNASEEARHGTSDSDSDSDDDGIDDGDEIHTYGTDPLSADSDNDGTTDAHEVTDGTDPNDAGDVAYFWVDFAQGVNGNGFSTSPFNTITDAVSTVPGGAKIRIVAGDTSETITIDKNLLIEAIGGVARLGG